MHPAPGGVMYVEGQKADNAYNACLSTSGQYTSSAAGDEWTWCADEGTQCSFTGSKQVRYGEKGQYKEGEYTVQTHTDGVSCTNKVFGDPLEGTKKTCEIRDTVPGPEGIQTALTSPHASTKPPPPVVKPPPPVVH